VDRIDKATRSRIMGRIRAKHSVPEMLVRRFLFAAGYRYRLHGKGLPGRPDIVFPSRRVAVFVHGCFWHGHSGCALFKIPRTNTKFWSAKFRANTERDARKREALRVAGWRVATIWECAITDRAAKSLPRLVRFLNGRKRSVVIG